MRRQNDWKDFYRGFSIKREGAGWAVRTGAGRTIHPSACFQAMYTDRQRAERVYGTLIATKTTQKAARSFCDRKIRQEN
jgi:hypothetical protein